VSSSLHERAHGSLLRLLQQGDRLAEGPTVLEHRLEKAL